MIPRVTTNTLFSLAGILFLALIPMGMLGWMTLIPYVGLAAFLIGGSAFCYATYGQIKDMLKVSGYRHAFVIYHIVILFISVIPVRGWVTLATGMPGADYSTTCYLLPVLIYPLFWACTFLLFLAALMMIFNFQSGSNVMRCHQDSARQQLGVLGRFVGAFSMVFGILFIFASYGTLMLGSPTVKWIAYVCDYHHINRYPGIDQRKPALLHENGVVSYATIDHWSVIITVDHVTDSQ